MLLNNLTKNAALLSGAAAVNSSVIGHLNTQVSQLLCYWLSKLL